MLEIKSLIGYFDLDPNRVASLVLDIFQDQWDNEAYPQLLPLFSQEAVSASLAFVFAHYKVQPCLCVLWHIKGRMPGTQTCTRSCLWTCFCWSLTGGHAAQALCPQPHAVLGLASRPCSTALREGLSVAFLKAHVRNILFTAHFWSVMLTCTSCGDT